MTLNDLDCAIFVDGDLDEDELLRVMSELACGTVVGTVIEVPFGEIDVQGNSDFDPQSRAAFPDGFLFFAHVVEVYANEGGADGAKEFVARALSHLWASGVPAVAACDYEDELPAAGGRADRDLPWPAAREPHAETDERAG